MPLSRTQCAVLVAVAGGAVLGAVSCRPAPAPVWRVGLIGTFEGNAANSSGIPGRRGAELAVDSLNRAGGVVIAGVAHRVVLVPREAAVRPDAAASAARALVNLDSVDVIVGPQQSALAIAAGAVAEASDVPLVAPMASGAAVTADRRLVSRLAFQDAVQGAVLARFAWDSLGVRRAAALFDAASPYGRDIVALFRSTFEARGGHMAAAETFDDDGSPDHTAQLRRLIATQPDALLLPNFKSRDSTQFRIARQLGFRGRFLGSDAWDGIALSRRDDPRGIIIVANWDRRSDRPRLRAFVQAHTTRYPGETARATAAATFDAVLYLAAAAARAGQRSGAPLMTAFRSAGRLDGAFGEYVFDGTGNPVRGAVLLEVGPDSTRVRATASPPP
jgi:branched-chain amino acid transport system substrate-binding protein